MLLIYTEKSKQVMASELALDPRGLIRKQMKRNESQQRKSISKEQGHNQKPRVRSRGDPVATTGPSDEAAHCAIGPSLQWDSNSTGVKDVIKALSKGPGNIDHNPTKTEVNVDRSWISGV